MKPFVTVELGTLPEEETFFLEVYFLFATATHAFLNANATYLSVFRFIYM